VDIPNGHFSGLAGSVKKNERLNKNRKESGNITSNNYIHTLKDIQQRDYNIYARQEIAVLKWDHQRSCDHSQTSAICTIVKLALSS